MSNLKYIESARVQNCFMAVKETKQYQQRWRNNIYRLSNFTWKLTIGKFSVIPELLVPTTAKSR
jgi:hypothetical protein